MSSTSSDIQHYIEEKLASGEFQSAEELAVEAIRVYRELETRYADFAGEVHRRVERADAGELAPLDIEAIKAELSAEIHPDGTPK